MTIGLVIPEEARLASMMADGGDCLSASVVLSSVKKQIMVVQSEKALVTVRNRVTSRSSRLCLFIEAAHENAMLSTQLLSR
jgi:hypothetical protein